LGRGLASERIDRVACSPLERTRDTAAAIATAGGQPAPEIVEALIEIDMGDWTGVAFGDLGGVAWDAWNSARGSARIPGGETMAEAQARIVGYMTDAARAADDATIALVTHSDMIRAAVAHALGLSLDHLLRFEVGPASVSRVVMGDWGAKLISLNERVAA
jgi:broad specificity phosphatase PhoE